MEIENATLIQEKIDDILHDTEGFVNATKQLNTVKHALDQYIKDVSVLTKDLSSISKKAYDCVDYAGKFFNGDFTKEIKKLISDIVVAVEMTAEQGKRLKVQYDDLLKADNFTELQTDHSNILDSIGEVFENGKEIKTEVELNGKKLDQILELLNNEKYSSE